MDITKVVVRAICDSYHLYGNTKICRYPECDVFCGAHRNKFITSSKRIINDLSNIDRIKKVKTP